MKDIWKSILIKGQKLKSFRDAIDEQFVPDIDVGHKVRNLGIFDFRSLLNISMLLTESETARVLRQTILDIVIDTINKRTGGGTKYINQRDEEFIQAAFSEENYRKAEQGSDPIKGIKLNIILKPLSVIILYSTLTCQS